MKNSMLKRKVKQSQINQIDVTQELERNAKSCLNNILLLSDDPTIRETAFNCLYSIEQALEINQRKPEMVDIEDQIQALMDGSSWFDMLLLPLSDFEVELYKREGKVPPNFRLMIRIPKGDWVNYRFHAGKKTKIFNKLCKNLRNIACDPSPSKKAKEAYNAITKAILFMDFDN